MWQLSRDIKEKARGKKVAVIGVGTFCTLNMRFLLELGLDICFFVDEDYQNRKFFEYSTGFQVKSYEALDPTMHFPFIYQHNFFVIDSIKHVLQERGFQEQDYLVFTDAANRDIEYRNMKIGKGASSYDVLLNWSTHVESIGRYSSINHTAQVVFDHNRSSITTVNIRCSPPPVRERMSIGHDVWIGANVVINASKTRNIGDGAIIGTGAVVISDVPPYAVIAGVPGKVKKYRFTRDEIDILRRVQWWNWDDETMYKYRKCFTDPHIFFEQFKD